MCQLPGSLLFGGIAGNGKALCRPTIYETLPTVTAKVGNAHPTGFVDSKIKRGLVHLLRNAGQ